MILIFFIICIDIFINSIDNSYLLIFISKVYYNYVNFHEISFIRRKINDYDY